MLERPDEPGNADELSSGDPSIWESTAIVMIDEEFDQALAKENPPDLRDFWQKKIDANALPVDQRVPLLCQLLLTQREHAWKRGDQRPLEDDLQAWPELRESPEAMKRLSQHQRVLERTLKETHAIGLVEAALRDEAPLNAVPQDAAANRDVPAQPPSSKPEPSVPQRIGPYHVERLLGSGSFGAVYLGYDEQQHRSVAIKVPVTTMNANARASLDLIRQTLLQEIHTVAKLRHRHIVELFDFDMSDANAENWYLSYRYIEGCTLRDRLESGPMEPAVVATLAAKIADALDYAHQCELIHRDIKPENILLDANDEPFVLDFGLAVFDEEVLRRNDPESGTLLYMSPEQVKAETHRLTFRADIYSLGATLYELLTGRHPFEDKSRPQLKQLIVQQPPKPMRLYNKKIPKELDDIVLKALAKRQEDRHDTAGDLAQELRGFLATWNPDTAAEPSGADLLPATPSTKQPRNTPTPTTSPSLSDVLGASSAKPNSSASPDLDDGPLHVVPKGLRAFDAEDAEFFLRLLPGPRDKQGLPESVRFWKTRIEQTDPDKSFPVGLLYGPSGCGKSSLLKAGLLPRLGPSVLHWYVEATPHDTEQRVQRGLERLCPTLMARWRERQGQLSSAMPAPLLHELISLVRCEPSLRKQCKLLIVLDQFEQWLHIHRSEMRGTELVSALRQADGVGVQFLLLVRDDFWSPTSQLFEDLELDPNKQNSRRHELFDLRHARRVLHAFGHAHGCLPPEGDRLPPDQDRFLDEAVQGLSEDGKVISVRLALFADMLKSREWTPATLQQIGGVSGVGVTFLEENFAASTAPIAYRTHQAAVRGVLAALLPEAGTDIKGHIVSKSDLLSASGYATRPRDFDTLLNILDHDLRLITPVAAEESKPESRGNDDTGAAISNLESQISNCQPAYQLAHDYLVPSISEWLTKKQKETRRGRAELLLSERAAVWRAQPDPRHLPSVTEYLAIRSWIPKWTWTEPQRRMMRVARQRHLIRWGSTVGLFLTLLLTLAIGGPIMAVRQRELRTESEMKQRETERQLRVSTALHLAGESEHARHIYPVRSLLLAMHAVESTRAHNEPVVPSAEKNLRDALSLVTGRGIAVQDTAITCQSISPDGRWLVTGSTDTTARVWDLSASDPGATPRVLRGHEGGIKCLSISPNSRWLVTGSWDGTARVWNLLASDGGLSPHILRGHEEGILCLSISPDGRWLITGSGNPFSSVTRDRSKDNTARVWDLSAVDPSASSRILRGHEDNIECLSITPDGRWLITGSRDKMARIWDLSAIDPVASSRALRGHEDSIECLAISPDSRWLITGSRDKTARIWDLSAVDPGASPRVLHGHDEGIGCVSISSDGHWLVTAAGYGPHAEDNAAKVWDLSASDPGASVRIFDPENGITCLGFSPDARWLVTGGHHAAVVWDLFAEHPDLSRRVLTGFDGEVRCLTFSSDGHWLMMAGDTISESGMSGSRICDLTARDATVTPCVFRADTLELGFLAMSPNQRWLVASGKLGRTSSVWDLSVADPVASRRLLLGHGAIAITPDSRWLAIGGNGFSVGLWDLLASNLSRLPNRVLRGHEGGIKCLSISPDGRWLITGSTDNTARVWSLSAADPSASPLVLRGHDSAIKCLAISSNGRWLVTGSSDTTVRVWDLSAVNPNASVRVLSGHQGSVELLSLSPNGRWLVSTDSWANTAILWDLSTSDPIANSHVLDGHQSRIECLVFRPDGHWLVTGSSDKTAQVWDLSADYPGTTARVLSGHDSTINCLATSPDGRWLVTGCGHVVSAVTPSYDTSLRVWDMSISKPGSPRILPGHGIATTCLAFSSDGKWIVSGGEDERVHVSDLSVDRIMNGARLVAGRTLSREERMQHNVLELMSEAEAKHVDDGELPILFPTMYTSLKTDASWHERQITDVSNRQSQFDREIFNVKQTTVADARQAWYMITFHRSRQVLLKPDDPDLWQQLQRDAEKTIADRQPLPQITVKLFADRGVSLPALK